MQKSDIVELNKERRLKVSECGYVIPQGKALCMRYAMQELAEWDDAVMRMEHPEHMRNSARTPDPKMEFAQALCMVLDCYMFNIGGPSIEKPLGKHERTLGRLLRRMTTALGCIDTSMEEDAFALLLDEMVASAHELGYNVAELINARYNQVEEKYCDSQGIEGGH